MTEITPEAVPDVWGLLWSDPELGTAWPLAAAEATVDARDAAWPTLALDSPFTYGEDA